MSGSPHRFQDRIVSPTKWFRAYRHHEQPGSVAAFPFPTKQFSEADETGLKPRSAPIVGDQTMESINVRHHPQGNLSRIHANLPFPAQRSPGADLAWRLISSCTWRLIRGSLAAKGNTPPRRLGLRGKAMSVIGSIEATHELCANLDNLIELTKESRAPIRALSFIERAREDLQAYLNEIERTSSAPRTWSSG
jgi:hypothetical protein